jgi:hypothetical protein
MCCILGIAVVSGRGWSCATFYAITRPNVSLENVRISSRIFIAEIIIGKRRSVMTKSHSVTANVWHALISRHTPGRAQAPGVFPAVLNT